MTKLKIALILLSCILGVLTENQSSEAQAKIDNFLKPPSDTTVPQKQFSQIYNSLKEEPSFISKVASWIFPFGDTSATPLDSASSETQQRYAPQYLPQSQNGYSKLPCNPCNREPWIPVAGTHGQNTVIGFVQQSHSQNQGYLPPSHAYGSPPSNMHPPPLVSQHTSPESHQYGRIPPQKQHVPLHSQYGVPRDHYGVPTNIKPVFDQPPANFRAPAQHFIPPPLPKHAIPIFQNTGLPSQKLNYLKQGLPPSKQGVLKSGPKFRLNSSPQHGPPIPLNFGKPQIDKHKFSFPSSATKAAYSVGTHSVKSYAPTPANQGVLLQPPPFNVDYMATSLLNYQPSSSNGISSNHQLSSISPQNYNVPSLSYASGNVEQSFLSSLRHNNYPISNFGQSSIDGLNTPIAFPGLSFHQIAPLHNSQPFLTDFSSSAFNNLPQHDSKVKIQTNSEQNVQIIPSVRVADYLASIEHPINLIQSPLVEVIATENNPPKESEAASGYTSNKVQLSDNPIVVDTPDEDTYAAATAQNASYYNPTQNENQNNGKDVETAFNLNNQNLDNTKGSSTLNYNFSDEQLRTILQSQKPFEDLSVLNVNFTKHFGVNEFSQSSIGNTQNQKDSQISEQIENQLLFAQPPMDYSNWTPTFGTLSTSMVPPPLKEPVWNTALTSSHLTSTTKKPKQVQIIIPYISNNPSSEHLNTDLYKNPNGNIRGSKENSNSVGIAAASSSSTLSLYTQPPTIEEPVWSHYLKNYNQAESSKLAAAVSTEKSRSVSNIRDLLLKEEQINDTTRKLPFDVIRLQKNIDDWTEQEFSNGIRNPQKASTNGKLIPSKKIPTEYLTTQPYNKTPYEITTIRNILDIPYDHEPAGSQTKISKVESNEDIDTNFILTETTPFSTLTTTESLTTLAPVSMTLITSRNTLINATTAAEDSTTESPFMDTSLATPGLGVITLPVATTKPMWEKLQVSFSSQTKEKIYVVTPQPWRFTPKEINENLLSVTESVNAGSTSAKFSVVIQPEGNKRTKELTEDTNGGLHVVYSEWPHLINNLQTTTTEKPKAANHPLFGLMNLNSYTPPPNSTVETYGGHSRVITVVTPTSVTKKNIGLDEKNTTTKTIPLAVG